MTMNARLPRLANRIRSDVVHLYIAKQARLTRRAPGRRDLAGMRFIASVAPKLEASQGAQIVTEECRQEYNHRRPHSSLGYLPPAVFAEQVRLSLPVD